MQGKKIDDRQSVGVYLGYGSMNQMGVVLFTLHLKYKRNQSNEGGVDDGSNSKPSMILWIISLEGPIDCFYRLWRSWVLTETSHTFLQ